MSSSRSSVGEHAERGLDEPEPLLHVHAPGAVDDERDVRPRPVVLVDLLRGDRDPDPLPLLVAARVEPALDPDPERAVLGRLVAVVERVDPLLGPHGLGRRPDAVGEQRLRDRERAGVHVERERRLRVGPGVDGAAHAVVDERRVVERVGAAPARSGIGEEAVPDVPLADWSAADSS